MTRKQFVEIATMAAERHIEVPTGWWGKWRDVTNGVVRVTFTGSCWRVSRKGVAISRHDSRNFAIRKAAKL